jgi:hypothetical protein
VQTGGGGAEQIEKQQGDCLTCSGGKRSSRMIADKFSQLRQGMHGEETPVDQVGSD